MYIEFLFVVAFYIFTLKRRDVLFEVAIPVVIAVVFYFLHSDRNIVLTSSSALKESLSFMRILLGFTMASLALFLTKNPNLGEVKQYATKRYVNKKQLSLYDYIVLSFSYLIIVEALIQFTYFAFAILSVNLHSEFMLIVKTLYVFLLFHVILATIRAITEVYQTLQGKKPAA